MENLIEICYSYILIQTNNLLYCKCNIELRNFTRQKRNKTVHSEMPRSGLSICGVPVWTCFPLSETVHSGEHNKLKVMWRYTASGLLPQHPIIGTVLIPARGQRDMSAVLDQLTHLASPSQMPSVLGHVLLLRRNLPASRYRYQPHHAVVSPNSYPC